jgi:molybdate transport system substrate-binding protein
VKCRAAVALIAILIVAACSTTGSSASPEATSPSVAPSSSASAAPSPSLETVELTVFAAASLSNVLAKVKPAYEAAHPGTAITLSTDSSAALETQIEQGAPADVFLSADTTNPKKLVDAHLSAGDAVVFAGNKLTIVVPTDDPGKVTSPKDLAKSGLRIIAAGDAVPITKYATQLVGNLAKLPGYPADFATAYTANVASKEDNVKAVIGKIELGEGDAAIVYVTDAASSTKVKTIDVPAEANVPASYAGVVVGTSKHQEPARTFLGWLTSPDGQAILSAAGFLPPSG